MAKSFLLCYITDRTAFAPDEGTRRKRLLEKIAEAARAGVDYIQLREKDLATRALEVLSKEAVGLLHELRAQHPERTTKLLINSRTDVALASGADGVHLRSEDISPAEIRKVWQRGAGALARVLPKTPLIGVSCHTTAEVLRAEADGASFAVFAPVFEKKDLPERQPAGLPALHQACRAKIPVLALGGVSPANARQCLEAGAAGIAAIRLFQENEIATVMAHLRGSL